MQQPQLKNNSQVQVPSSMSNKSLPDYQIINGDTEQPRKLCIIRSLIVFFCIFVFLMALAVPKAFVTHTNRDTFKSSRNQTCNPSSYDNNTKTLECLQYMQPNPKLGLLLKDLKNLHQLALLNFKIIRRPTQKTARLVQKIAVQQSILNEIKDPQDGKNYYTWRQKIYQFEGNFSYSNTNYMGSSVEEEGNGGEKRDVDRYFFAYNRIARFLNSQENTVLVIVKMTNYTQTLLFQRIQLQGTLVNPAFSIFTIVLRGVLCLISLIRAILYLRRYIQLPTFARILQIRLTAVASFLLILFNDPFYALTVLVPNPITTFLSVLYVIAFLVFLQLMWVFMLRKIYSQQLRKETTMLALRNSWKFYLFFFVILVLMLVLFAIYAYSLLQNVPVIQYTDIRKLNAIPVIAILAVLMSAIVLYQIIMLVLIIIKYICQKPLPSSSQEANPTIRINSPQLLQRNKIYLQIYPFFLLIFILCFIFGGAMPFLYQGTWILYQYCFMNLFVFIMQFLYITPRDVIRNGAQRARQVVGESSEIQMQETKAASRLYASTDGLKGNGIKGNGYDREEIRDQGKNQVKNFYKDEQANYENFSNNENKYEINTDQLQPSQIN